MKLKSLIANFATEVAFKADDMMDQVILDKKSAPTPTLPSRCTSAQRVNW